MSRAYERELDDEIFTVLADIGLADNVTYRRLNGELISTIAEIDANSELVGEFQSSALEYTIAITLKRADIGEPCRGDVVVDEVGENYIVTDIDEYGSDRSLVRVMAKWQTQ